MAQAVLNLAKLVPTGMAEIDVIEASVEGGRSLSGIAGASDLSGGGYWQVKYGFDLILPDEHKEWNRLAALLRGGARSVVVPMLTDYVGPFALDAFGEPDLTSITLSSLDTDAALNAGTVDVEISGGVDLVGGEIFEINHGDPLGYRAYQVAEVLLQTSSVWTVNIRPTMRAATTAATAVNWVRPRCLMALPAGDSMPWNPEGKWHGRQQVTFVEYFGSGS